MLQINSFLRKDISQAPAPNYWDILALIFIAAIIFAVSWLLPQMAAPFSPSERIPISLSPDALPAYCLRSVVRICIALFFSLLVTMVMGTAAAKSRFAERIIIPTVDILQSVPVLGFLSVGVWGFLALFPGSLLGPECAAIFAIFTAQVWNMILSFYQSVSTIPKSLREAAHIMQLSAWQRFWRLEVPFAIPSLLWNMMLSISASWFFMVASEAIDVNHQMIMLPGIGSYIATAIQASDMQALSWAIGAMFITIVIYDQMFFRPIMQWGERFRPVNDTEAVSTSWLAKLLSRARLLQFFFQCIRDGASWLLRLTNRVLSPMMYKPTVTWLPVMTGMTIMVRILFAALVLWALFFLAHFFSMAVTQADVGEVLYLGAVSTMRIFVVVCLCLLVWTPIGVWVGLQPDIARRIQPIIQILSAFPANVLFPFFATWILQYHLNPDIWLSPLMILGTQWYIVFNVIAGTMSIPEAQRYAVDSLGLSRWLWWSRFMLPALLPHIVTGAMTATGGAWNASIIAEAINWGGVQLYATGLGAYIAYQTKMGHSAQMALGIVMMCIYVLVINRVFWQPLYHYAQRRSQTEG
jgi:NitT/TauT family transport system permease protein